MSWPSSGLRHPGYRQSATLLFRSLFLKICFTLWFRSCLAGLDPDQCGRPALRHRAFSRRQTRGANARIEARPARHANGEKRRPFGGNGGWKLGPKVETAIKAILAAAQDQQNFETTEVCYSFFLRIGYAFELSLGQHGEQRGFVGEAWPCINERRVKPSTKDRVEG